MPPPKLAADAPVLNAAHPVVVNLRPSVREEPHLLLLVGRGSAEPTFERSEASSASVLPRDARCARAGIAGRLGSSGLSPHLASLRHTCPRLLHARILQK